MGRRRGERIHLGLAAYLAMIPIVGIVVGVVGWRLLQQDAALQRQQIDDRLETSADVVAHELRSVVAAQRARLAELAEPDPSRAPQPTQWLEDLPSDTFVVLFEGDGVRTRPPGRLLFRPDAEPGGGRAPRSVYTEGELLEFRHDDPEAGLAVVENNVVSDLHQALDERRSAGTSTLPGEPFSGIMRGTRVEADR